MLAETRPDALKVLIYATAGNRLLAFDEPDFPHVYYQVPGGTIEDGEDPADAARREFLEETGIECDEPFLPLSIDDYHFVRDDRTIWHRRHYFHVPLTGNHPKTWIHWETTPYDGGAPVRFRFFWLRLGEADQRLGYGMERCLHLMFSPRA